MELGLKIMLDLDDILRLDVSTLLEGEKFIPRTIVRLTTCFYSTPNGIHMRKDIVLLKRKSNHDFLLEDARESSPAIVFNNIINLDECKDGVYEVTMCEIFRDRESGYIEDYSYMLMKLE